MLLAFVRLVKVGFVMALTHHTDLDPKTEKPLSSTLGENPAAKTKGESRIKWPKSVASHGNGLIISTSFQVVSSGVKKYLRSL